MQFLSIIYVLVIVFLSFWKEVNATLCDCKTSSHLDPVCATNGVAYRNAEIVECINKCSNLDLKILPYEKCSLTKRECLCPSKLEATSSLLENDGNSYTNKVVIDCTKKCPESKKMNIKPRGIFPKKKKKDPCLCSGTKKAKYVCGDDNHTYRNRATVKCNNSCYKMDIKIASLGPCPHEIGKYFTD